MIESGGPVLRKLKAAAVGKRLSLTAQLRLLFGVATLCATTMAAQPGETNPGGLQTMQQALIDTADAAACASCHKEVAKGFANNPHSGAARIRGGNVVTCESCHGPGKAHEEGSDVASIFNPATAKAKAMDEECQTCHGGKHKGNERATHGEGNVSCIDCHSIHSAATPKHLLKRTQPELCYQCHEEIKPQFSMPFRHKVAEGLIQCTDCHDAHGADRESPRHSSAWQLDVCTKCHDAMAGPFVYEHPAVKAEGCTACHVPHGGANPKLLTQANVNTICLQCHLPSLNFTTGQPAVPSHIQSAQSQSCTSCHSGIHGSDASNMFLNSTQGRDDR
ncbi:MAG: DmsE family decaheme c-type cytochrome [Terracidiphilus sp.]